MDSVPGGRPAALAAAAGLRASLPHLTAAVLVEGASDRAAVDVLAERSGRDLAAEGIAVVPMGGATNISHYLAAFGPAGLDVGLAGLCDAGEEGDFWRGLARAGLAPGPGRAGLERLGFFVCDADLEDELIRALGIPAVEQLIAREGDLASLRIFQGQPAQRGRPATDLLHRFMGTRSGRKAQYARVMAAATDPMHVPRPLDQVLSWLR